MAELTINASSIKNMRRYGTGYLTIHNSATANDVNPGTAVENWYLAGSDYQITHLAMLFDTSSGITGAITSAKIQFTVSAVSASSAFSLVVRNGQPTYPHNPVVVGDYLYSNYSGDGGSVAITSTGAKEITLNSTGRGWIQRDAITKLVLINSNDIAITTPTGKEQAVISGVKLVVTYTASTVTTNIPTNILRVDPTTLTANGTIETSDTITTRGFKYGLTEADTWNKSETGTYSEGAFSLTLISLTADTTYYIRAYATAAWGTVYGSYLEFKTAYPYGANKVEIKSEATASAADIALVGGKRSLTINNHLIQTQTLADIISAAYLADYKDQKTKLTVTKPTPAPYEVGDTIERIGADMPYYAAVSALISYAAAVNAENYYGLLGRDMLIRKLNVSFSAGNYVSIIELESS